MSSVAANSERRLRPLDTAVYLATGRAVRVISVAGVVVGVAAGLLVATSDHLVHPVAFGLEVAIVVVGTVGVALYWAVARPGNPIALWLLAYAASAVGLALVGAASPLLYSIGVLFRVPIFILGYYLVFAFPLGRVVGRLEKLLLVGVGWAIVTESLAIFFSPVVSIDAPLGGCNAKCPSNALMITDLPGLADGFGTTGDYLGAVIAAAIVACLCYRLVRASAPRRRASLPVYVPAFLLTIPFCIFHAANVGLFTLNPTSVDRIGWFVTVGRIFLTFGFLLAIVQAAVFAGSVLKKILDRVGQGDDAAHLRDLVSEVLDDPKLELAFDVEHDTFVDSRGQPLHLADIEAGRSVTVLRRHGQPVALIAHDPVLESDPELVQAAGQAVLLAVESGRLDSKLQSKIDELRISRRRIVSAAEAERQKLERDLHDGAQQRLTAIQIELALLSDSVDDPDLAVELDRIAEDTAAAVDDLRGLAHGIYPAVLHERGLADGLRAHAVNAPARIDVIDDGIGRCPPTVEAAVYFCALEAIQNATKHAGPGAHVMVTLGRRADEIEFAVVDDGVGFAAGKQGDGIGLTDMRDRIGAVGGEVEVSSAPGRGTTVRGHVPDTGGFTSN